MLSRIKTCTCTTFKFDNIFVNLFQQVLGTPTREQIREMNPNYTEFKFPQIKSHPWAKVRLLFVTNHLYLL